MEVKLSGSESKEIEGLKLARLIEYSCTFCISMMVSIFVIYRTKCQMQIFSIYVMIILIFS
jgi:hypothetical protein